MVWHISVHTISERWTKCSSLTKVFVRGTSMAATCPDSCNCHLTSENGTTLSSSAWSQHKSLPPATKTTNQLSSVTFTLTCSGWGFRTTSRIRPTAIQWVRYWSTSGIHHFEFIHFDRFLPLVWNLRKIGRFVCRSKMERFITFRTTTVTATSATRPHKNSQSTKSPRLWEATKRETRKPTDINGKDPKQRVYPITYLLHISDFCSTDWYLDVVNNTGTPVRLQSSAVCRYGIT